MSSARVVHYRPERPFSYPIPSKGPNQRCFVLKGAFAVCPVGMAYGERTSSDRRNDVTCKRCLRIMAIGRFDNEETVAEVLSR